jgi:hypothetical protein
MSNFEKKIITNLKAFLKEEEHRQANYLEIVDEGNFFKKSAISKATSST